MPDRPTRSGARPIPRPPHGRRNPGRSGPLVSAGAPARRSPISPFLTAYYLFSLTAVAAGWLKGGHPERLGALATVVAYMISWFSHPWRIGAFYAGDAALDLAMALFFVWLALRSDRWWPLLMAGVMSLTLLVHASSLLFPHIGGYADISARVGLGLLSALVLLAGVVERWLAGEQAVSAAEPWRSPSSPRQPEGFSP